MKIVKTIETVHIEKERILVEIRQYLKNNILIFDGAMGTMLQQKG